MAIRKDLFESLCKVNPDAVRRIVSEHGMILKSIMENQNESSSNKLKAMELRYENMAIIASLESVERERSDRDKEVEILKKRYEYALSKLRIFSPKDADKAESIE